MSSRSSSLIPLFLIVCACPHYLVMLVWLLLVLVWLLFVGIRVHLCSFGCHSRLSVLVLPFTHTHSFGFHLCLFVRLLCTHLGLFGFVWAHLSVSNTHLVHRS